MSHARFSLGVEGLPGAKLSVVGLEHEANPIVTVPPDELKSIRLYVTLDKQAVAALGGVATSFAFVVTDVADRRAHRAQRDLPGTVAMSGTAWFANGIRGRHVLIGFVAFFGVIFLVNGIFLYYALTTFGGGETGRSLPQWPATTTRRLPRPRGRPSEAGKAELDLRRASPAGLRFALRDKSGEPVAGLHLDATVGRPATDREDLAAKFRRDRSRASMPPS